MPIVKREMWRMRDAFYGVSSHFPSRGSKERIASPEACAAFEAFLTRKG